MMHRIVVANAKGGCGKTTIATNLAAYFAMRQQSTVLFDHDPQGSGLAWLKQRSPDLPPIHGVAAHRAPANGMTRAWQLRVPQDAEWVVVDTPAGLNGTKLSELVRQADSVIIPVLSSPIDIHSAARFIHELLVHGKARMLGVRLAVIANRVRHNTLMYQELKRFLNGLQIPFITSLRDTQNYVKAAQQGICVHELNAPMVERDVEQWAPLVEWLEEGCDAGRAVYQPRTA